MEDGRPFLDMAHVITSLNRLDAGIPDKVGSNTRTFCYYYIWGGKGNKRHITNLVQVCLMSRDELNVLVVSYAELKNCLEQARIDITFRSSKHQIRPFQSSRDENTRSMEIAPRLLKLLISELRRGPRSCHGQAKAHKHAPGLGLRNQNRNANEILWLFNQSKRFLSQVKARNQYQDCFWIGKLQISLKVLQRQRRILELREIISFQMPEWKERKMKK